MFHTNAIVKKYFEILDQKFRTLGFTDEERVRAAVYVDMVVSDALSRQTLNEVDADIFKDLLSYTEEKPTPEEFLELIGLTKEDALRLYIEKLEDFNFYFDKKIPLIKEALSKAKTPNSSSQIQTPAVADEIKEESVPGLPTENTTIPS